jgi:hypothetical protein
MPWSDIFPILSDEMVEEAVTRWTEADETLYQDEFGVEYATGRRGSSFGSILSVSLFCKATNQRDEYVPVTDSEVLRSLEGSGIRHNPWSHYVQPLLDHGPGIVEERPDVTLRVYLAKDLEFLVPSLTSFAEVVVMRGSSERSAPGMLWRFLALGENGVSVTMLDADLISTTLEKIRVTDFLPQANVGTWRVPALTDLDEAGYFFYRTMVGCYWGTKIQVPIERLLKAFRWWQRRGGLQTWAPHPATGTKYPLVGAFWPDYGSDEYFSSVVLYPRLALSGILTITGVKPASYMFPLDIEYVSWANPNSFIDYSLYRRITREPKRDPQGRGTAPVSPDLIATSRNNDHDPATAFTPKV